MTELTLAISSLDHDILKAHLFPGDDLEAAAILICGRAGRFGERLCVSSVITIPYNACKIRTSTKLDWPGSYLENAIDSADAIGGSILLVHSHPGGYLDFSNLDDESDQLTIPCLVHGSIDESIQHGSAIMVPNGRMKVRLYTTDMLILPVNRLWKIGTSLVDLTKIDEPEVLPFSSDMSTKFRELSFCVVGASGTGSPTLEMLARMGAGCVVPIDFDKMELRNLNRIINSTYADAKSNRLKVDVVENSLKKYRPDMHINSIAAPISDEEAIIAASGCDMIFCCVDTMEGRLYCDLISQACLIPLIDMGVMIPTRKSKNGQCIADVCARIDYVYPGGASLWDRGEITGEGLRAEDMRRTDPETYALQLKEGYIKGIAEEAPSVIALNMMAASRAVMEAVARFCPYRHDDNLTFDRIFLSLASCETDYELSSKSPTPAHRSIFGQGLKYPLLGIVARTQKIEHAA